MKEKNPNLFKWVTNLPMVELKPHFTPARLCPQQETAGKDGKKTLVDNRNIIYSINTANVFY